MPIDYDAAKKSIETTVSTNDVEKDKEILKEKIINLWKSSSSKTFEKVNEILKIKKPCEDYLPGTSIFLYTKPSDMQGNDISLGTENLIVFTGSKSGAALYTTIPNGGFPKKYNTIFALMYGSDKEMGYFPIFGISGLENVKKGRVEKERYSIESNPLSHIMNHGEFLYSGELAEILIQDEINHKEGYGHRAIKTMVDLHNKLNTYMRGIIDGNQDSYGKIEQILDSTKI